MPRQRSASLTYMSCIDEAGEAEAARGERARRGQRPEAAAQLPGLLVVDFRLAVVLAVVDAEVEVAVVPGEVVVEGRADVRRGEEALALGEHRALEAVAVDAFRVVDVRRLLLAEARPRALGHVVVEVPLREGVLEAEGIAAVERAAGAGLAGDVGRDAEGDAVGDVAGDVDVAAADVERAQRDAVAVGVVTFGSCPGSCSRRRS